MGQMISFIVDRVVFDNLVEPWFERVPFIISVAEFLRSNLLDTYTLEADSVPVMEAPPRFVVPPTLIDVFTTSDDTFSVLTFATDRVVVPTNTLKFLDIAVSPDTSSAAPGAFPMPNQMFDVSPCRKGADEVEE